MYKISTRKSGMHSKHTHKILLTMKLTVLIIIIGIMQVSASSFAQKITLEEKNASLENVLKKIRKQSGYDFFFDRNVLQKAKPVNVNLVGVSLEDALKSCLSDQPFNYIVDDKTVVIIPKNGLATERKQLAPVPFAGIVQDESGNPLSGATIKAIDGKRSTLSDINGEFSLNVESGDRVVISYIGFTPDTIKIADNLSNTAIKIRIVLHRSENKLNEVVVSTGYQQIPKDRATGSFSFLDSKQLSYVRSASVLDQIKGQVPGVLIDIRTPDGTFLYRNNAAKTANFNIHGVSTYLTGQGVTSPLIVIDGFISQQDLSTFNPDDIENVSFLKDAAASSIWGVQASNGVIVINTKKGRNQQGVSINYSSNLSITAKPRLNYLSTMNASQYVDLTQDMITKGYITDQAGVSPYSLPINQAAEIIFQQQRGQITSAQETAALNTLRSRNSSDQVQQYLLQPATLQTHSLSLSGGQESATFFLSGSYAKEVPNGKGNSSNRISVLNNNQFKFLKIFTLSTGINLRWITDYNNGIGVNALGTSSSSLLPFDQIVDDNGNRVQRYFEYYSGAQKTYESKGYLPWGYNALDELDNANNVNTENYSQLTASLNAKIVKGLTADLSYRYEGDLFKLENYYSQQTYFTRNTLNQYTYIDPATKKLIYGIPLGGILQTTNESTNGYTVRGQLNYNRILNNDHEIVLLGGTEIRQSEQIVRNDQFYGYNDQTQSTMPVNYSTASASQPYTVTGDKQPVPYGATGFRDVVQRFLSYYGNGSYTYKNKYTATGSIRLDDFNYFGRSSQNDPKPTWSSGIAWNIDKEAFLEKISFINDLKLRATYGFTGNTARNVFPYTTLSLASVNDPKVNAPYASTLSASNPYLQFEKTKIINTGVDFSLFNNRLSGSVDIYLKRSTNLIVPVKVDPTNGFFTLLENYATLNGNGSDLQLLAQIIKKSNFNFTIGGSFSYNTNNVNDTNYGTDINSAAGTPRQTGNPITGYPIDYIFAYRWAGLDNTGQSQVYDRNGNIIKSSASISSVLDMKYMGRSTPTYFGGAHFTTRYKSFELYGNAIYKLGYVFVKQSLSGTPTSIFNGSFNLPLDRDVANRWKVPGDEANTNIPGLFTANASNSLTRYQQSDLNVLNGNQIRFDQLSLNYHVPAKWGNKIKVKSITAGISVRNLGIITWNKQDIDPDYQNTINAGILPPAKSFLFSLNVSL